MKIEDLTFPLDTNESKALYKRLGRLGAPVMIVDETDHLFDSFSNEEILAIAGEQSRFDFRLLYILVAFWAENFQDFNPFRLKENIGKMKTPSVWGVISEFSKKISSEQDLNEVSRILLRGLAPAPFQSYVIAPGIPRPEKMLQAVLRTSDEFFKWGFICDEIPLLKEIKAGKSATFSGERRRQILQSLFSSKGILKVSDYLEAVQHSISRQQAHKDLVWYPRVKIVSDRRGRMYKC